MHHRREIQSLEIHRRIALLIDGDPGRVIGKAVENLHRWLERHSGSALETVFKEWLNLLETLSPTEVADFIISGSERAVRMRQSSPFAGVLSPRELWSIKRGDYEAA